MREILSLVSPVLIGHSVVQVTIGLAMGQHREALIAIVLLPAIIGVAFLVAYPMSLIRTRR